MALTPEDVVNKRFQSTKFREGYDQDEVDDFLDEVVAEMRRLAEENETLKVRVGASQAARGKRRATTRKFCTRQQRCPLTIPIDAEGDHEPFSSSLGRLHEEARSGGNSKAGTYFIVEGHFPGCRSFV
jgi:DivIVA domain